MGTWNVRNINEKETELIEEKGEYGIDYLGITDTNMKGKLCKIFNSGNWVIMIRSE